MGWGGKQACFGEGAYSENTIKILNALVPPCNTNIIYMDSSFIPEFSKLRPLNQI